MCASDFAKAFEIVKSQREEKQESMISRQFFQFQVFQTYGNLVSTDTNISDKLSALAELCYFFGKILRH